MSGRKGSVMSGVHCLNHVDRLASPDFPYDYPVRPHAEGRSYEIPNADRSAALDIRVSRLQADQIIYMPYLQFSVVFDRDQAFSGRDELRQGIQESRLA